MAFTIPQNCTGCGACAAGCPVQCIEMQVDREGFRYPQLDTSRCISCQKCENVCPVIRKSPPQAQPRAYAVKHRDDAVRIRSSSGGVFPALAEFVLTNGGAVCGAVYAEDFSVVHQIAEDAAGTQKMQGAKYAQSRTEHLFAEIRRILEAGQWLLFVGTPCQVAGVKAFLGKDYEKLILVDMICHGVPSPKAWEKYLRYRRGKDAGDAAISAINQRDKCSGWSNYGYSVRIDYQNGKTYCAQQSKDVYLQGFVNNLYLRPSCAQCPFKGNLRCSDLTLGDYWGVWEQYPQADDNKGVSLVLVNTQKGAAYWGRIGEALDSFPVDLQVALAQNPSAVNSSAPHEKRDLFFERMDTCEFDVLVSGLLFGAPKKQSLLRRILRKIRK